MTEKKNYRAIFTSFFKEERIEVYVWSQGSRGYIYDITKIVGDPHSSLPCSERIAEADGFSSYEEAADAAIEVVNEYLGRKRDE